MTCPDCAGRGRIQIQHAFAGTLGSMPCSRCKGEGSVPDAMAQWMELGAQLRAWRDSQDRGLIEEARRRGISPALQSDYELGKCEPVFPPEYSELMGTGNA